MPAQRNAGKDEYVYSDDSFDEDSCHSDQQNYRGSNNTRSSSTVNLSNTANPNQDRFKSGRTNVSSGLHSANSSAFTNNNSRTRLHPKSQVIKGLPL